MNPLPHNVVTLLRERIESFEQLEILLLVHAERQRNWTAETVANALKITVAIATEALDHLCRKSLLDVRVGNAQLLFRFAPATPALDEDVAALAKVSRDRRVDVMSALSSNAVERMRTSTIRLFADAFLIGRGKKNG